MAEAPPEKLSYYKRKRLEDPDYYKRKRKESDARLLLKDPDLLKKRSAKLQEQQKKRRAALKGTEEGAELIGKDRAKQKRWRDTGGKDEKFLEKKRESQRNQHHERMATDPVYRKKRERQLNNIDTRYIRAQRDADDRGILWRINYVEYKLLVTAPCFYCRRPPTPGHLNGIDRFDNDGIYGFDNARSSCGPCNLSKKTDPATEFIARSHEVSRNFKHNQVSGYWSA